MFFWVCVLWYKSYITHCWPCTFFCSFFTCSWSRDCSLYLVKMWCHRCWRWSADRDVKDKSKRLEPGSAALFTWQDPLGKRELIWRCPDKDKDFKNELIKVSVLLSSSYVETFCPVACCLISFFIIPLSLSWIAKDNVETWIPVWSMIARTTGNFYSPSLNWILDASQQNSFVAAYASVDFWHRSC